MTKAEALAREFLDAARCWHDRARACPDDRVRQCAAALERLAEHTRGLPDFDHRIAALSCVGPIGDGSPDSVPVDDAPTTLQRIISQDGLSERHPAEPDAFLSSLYEEYLTLGKRDAEAYASLGGT